MKNGAYVISLFDKKSKGTHWVLLFIDINTAVYFDLFGMEYIPLLNEIIVRRIIFVAELCIFCGLNIRIERLF